MSETKHTPVWRVTEAWGQTKEERERGEPEILCFHEIVDEDGKTVLSTWAGPNLDAANLAAAAPAMLAALEDVEAANERVCALRSQAAYLEFIKAAGAEDALDALDDARRNARAAIAQAKGE